MQNLWKRSGNMPVVGEPPLPSISGKPSPPIQPTTMAIIFMLKALKVFIVKKPPLSASFPPMLSGCTICTGTFGNGVPMPGTITIRMRRRMAVSGQKMGMIIVLYCGAVLGTTIRLTAVPLSVTTTPAATATPTTVFGWCAVLGGLCNPFSLFTLFLFFPPSGGQIGRAHV